MNALPPWFSPELLAPQQVVAGRPMSLERSRGALAHGRSVGARPPIDRRHREIPHRVSLVDDPPELRSLLTTASDAAQARAWQEFVAAYSRALGVFDR